MTRILLRIAAAWIILSPGCLASIYPPASATGHCVLAPMGGCHE